MRAGAALWFQGHTERAAALIERVSALPSEPDYERIAITIAYTALDCHDQRAEQAVVVFFDAFPRLDALERYAKAWVAVLLAQRASEWFPIGNFLLKSWYYGQSLNMLRASASVLLPRLLPARSYALYRDKQDRTKSSRKGTPVSEFHPS